MKFRVFPPFAGFLGLALLFIGLAPAHAQLFETKAAQALENTHGASARAGATIKQVALVQKGAAK